MGPTEWVWENVARIAVEHLAPQRVRTALACIALASTNG
jgi:hypothetical protein